MKKLTTFLAASLLGLSSRASAAPSLEVHVGGSIRVSTTSSSTGSSSAHGQVIVRDHRAPQIPDYRPPMNQHTGPEFTYQHQAQPSAWFALGTVATGKQTVLPSQKKLDSLALQIKGRVQLDKVAIYFEGQTAPQIAQLDALLTDRSGLQTIDLAGTNREIKRVIVYSTASAGSAGEITVLGRDTRDATTIVMPGWTNLAAMATGKQTFTPAAPRAYRELALVSNSRSVALEQVVIRYTDGTQANIKLDATIGLERRAQVLDLEGKKIKSVIVYTDAAATGDVLLFAR